MLVPSLVFSAIQILTSVVDQSGLKKKLTTIVQNIFQVLSDSFGLMMQMHSFRTRLNLHTICLLYTYYKFWRHVKIVNRRGMYICILAGFGIVSRNAIFDKGILFTKHLVAVVGAECELLPSKNNNHNRKFGKFDLI